MDKAREMQLQHFSQSLQQAVRARDWQQLARVDAELAQALRRWPALAGWSAAERAALQALKTSHGEARAQCEAELDKLEQALTQMREGRGRWQAYAESANWQDDKEARA